MLRLVLISLCFPIAALAASPRELDALHAAIRTEALMEILSEEGIAQSEDLRESMFPGRGGIGWTTEIARLYEPEALYERFRSGFDAELEDKNIGSLLEFYGSETGALVALLEVEARRAIMSDEVEDAARAAFEALVADNVPRLALLERFAEVNGLVEKNVAGALNANLAFYQGLAKDGAFEMSEDEMLAEVWRQEAEIRDDTYGWVFGYMTLAYERLSDEQLGSYVDMSASEAGQHLNRALFAGFDMLFEEISFELGRTSARFATGDEL